MALFGIGTILYVSLLMINAIAILNEERFLAKSVLLVLCPLFLADHLTSWLVVCFTSSSRWISTNI